MTKIKTTSRNIAQENFIFKENIRKYKVSRRLIYSGKTFIWNHLNRPLYFVLISILHSCDSRVHTDILPYDKINQRRLKMSSWPRMSYWIYLSNKRKYGRLINIRCRGFNTPLWHWELTSPPQWQRNWQTKTSEAYHSSAVTISTSFSNKRNHRKVS